MKNYLIVLFILAIPICFATIPVEVLEIYDGDTIKAKIESGNEFSIRLVGIDCYETSKIHRAYRQAYINNLSINEVVKRGNIAKDYLKYLYKDTSSFSFDFMGIDKYGRVLANVYFDEININQDLLNKKLCMPYKFIDEQ